METRKKGSHLNIEERRQIAILDKEGWSPYAIGKKLKRASNTIRNELKRGTVKQMVGYQELEIYFPDTGEIVYKTFMPRILGTTINETYMGHDWVFSCLP